MVKYIAEKAVQEGQGEETRDKSKEPRTKNQEQRAKSQELASYTSEKTGEESCQSRAYINGLVSTAFVIFILLGFLSLAILLIVACFFPYIFRIPSPLEHLAITVTGLLGFQVMVSFPSRIFYSIFKGFQRFDLLNAIFASIELLNAMATLVLLFWGYGLISLVLLGVILSVLELAFQWLLLRRLYGVHVSLKQFQLRFWHDTARYTLWSSLLDLSNELGFRIDEIVIGILLNVSSITPYAIGRKLANAVFRLVEPVTDIFFPLSSQLKARKDSAGLRQIFLSGTRVSLFIATPLALCLFYYGEEVINLWIGVSYAGSKPILDIFLAVVVIWASLCTADNMLRGLGKLRFRTFLALVESFCNLTLSIILVKRYGLIGVGLGTLIPMGISGLFIVFPYLCKALDLSWREVLRISIFPAVLPLFFELVLLLVLELVPYEVNIITIVWRVALSLSAYVFLYHIFTHRLRFYKNISISGGGQAPALRARTRKPL
ncbi:MAG: oligosaccharide flippase family protein [Candidatus Tectomicrobia bacterium]|uniref:Oligosaccharide flippase family protein n=1 Tax=Tectimicrobiota bacterium TaxID=2528274 RepID=A0A933GLS9_UNCTE|nr:oligosaccharide flippase family protein [Candidatus Tectomicrobia bacterium]